jgi:hypothetical protein
MFSTREHSLRKKQNNDNIVLIKDTLHSITVRASGIQGGPARRVFALADEASHNCDTVLFISELRFDLSSHTIVCDAYALTDCDKRHPVRALAPHQASLARAASFQMSSHLWCLSLEDDAGSHPIGWQRVTVLATYSATLFIVFASNSLQNIFINIRSSSHVRST